MQTDEKDASYLWDMLEAARTIQQFVSSETHKGYTGNRMMQLAVEREFEVIGEAARRVSTLLKDAHTEIEWGPIISLRNIIAHEYGEIKHERVWIIARKKIPELIQNLEPLIPEIPPEW